MQTFNVSVTIERDFYNSAEWNYSTDGEYISQRDICICERSEEKQEMIGKEVSQNAKELLEYNVAITLATL